jgi:8-oxo-dGTP pyrophosphatase MutT (NUDIX family)
MISNPDVLVIGLDPYRVPGPWDPKPVADAIETGMKALVDRGFHAEACLVGLDGGDDIEARVTVALRTRSWDCVIVGGGIREPEEQLELFESIINLIRRHAPQAAIAFNHTPHDLADAAARALRFAKNVES